MTWATRITAGIIFLTIPSIIYGGYFLLTVLSGQQKDLELTAFQQSMFRAGHAHAGVLVILSLVVLLFVDTVDASPALKWIIRLGFPLAAILVSGGFFASAIDAGSTQPNGLIFILYAGVVLLISLLAVLGILLLKKPRG